MDLGGFKGHGAGACADGAYDCKFGPCIMAFIEKHTKQAPSGSWM